jgi:hypothetical protein
MSSAMLSWLNSRPDSDADCGEHGGSRVVLLRADGTQRTILFPGEAHTDGTPAWSPDDQTLAILHCPEGSPQWPRYGVRRGSQVGHDVDPMGCPSAAHRRIGKIGGESDKPHNSVRIYHVQTLVSPTKTTYNPNWHRQVNVVRT